MHLFVLNGVSPVWAWVGRIMKRGITNGDPLVACWSPSVPISDLLCPELCVYPAWLCIGDIPCLPALAHVVGSWRFPPPRSLGPGH